MDACLGKEVTEMAHGRQKLDTAVVSVRLTVDEIACLEQAARHSGKTLSQIVREAVRSYQGDPPRIWTLT